MTIKTESLVKFFDQVRSVTFWQRLFKWGQLRSLSYEAYNEFKLLLSEATRVSQEYDTTKNDYTVLRNDDEHLRGYQSVLENDLNNLKGKHSDAMQRTSDLSASLATKEEALRQNQEKLREQEAEFNALKEKVITYNEKISGLTSNLAGKEEALRQALQKAVELETNRAASDEKIDYLTLEVAQLREENTVFSQTEESRRTKYEKDVSTLNSVRDHIQSERQREVEEAQQKTIDRLNKMKEMWARHQDDVKYAIKDICERHTIEYVDAVPFKGNPDNTLKIADEYVIFDAKSPGSDDPANFPSYIKAQTEQVKKYIKEEDVKKDIFLVIPSNTVDVIDRFSYNMADYTVYIVTLDALEPIILSLKKLEEYEFVDKLSPDERDNICRVVGKFAHMTKRRIQIDQFFVRQFLEVLSKCDTDLPRDFLDKVIEFERSEKLNPPQEKRAKLISKKELETDSDRITREAEAKAIVFPESLQRDIRSMPLYDDDAQPEPDGK